MKTVAIFCSANNLHQKYIDPAKKLVYMLTKGDYQIVWGGSTSGLMGEIAETVKENGGMIRGISLSLFEEYIKKDADEIIMVNTLSERKAMMLEKSGAIIALVGGSGTLDELTEIVELKKYKIHNKPVAVLNTDNFYEGLILQLKRMQEDGFIDNTEDLIYLSEKPQDIFDYIESRIA